MLSTAKHGVPCRTTVSVKELNYLIRQVSVLSYERHHDDRKIWYTLLVSASPLRCRSPQEVYKDEDSGAPDEERLQDNGSRSVSADSNYFIARRFDHFKQLAQQLAGQCACAPKLDHKRRLYLLPKQKHIRRQVQIAHFLDALFQLSPSITQSVIVLNFFRHDTMPVLHASSWYTHLTGKIRSLRYPSSSSSSSSAPRPPLTAATAASSSPALHDYLSSQDQTHMQPPLVHVTSESTTTLGTGPHTTRDRLFSYTSTISTTSTSTTASHSPTHIKLKVVYDVHNIIALQVPRTITFDDLRSRIRQKLVHDVSLSPEFSLLFNDCRSSASSTYSKSVGNPLVISTDKEFVHIMNSYWSCLAKVTLRVL
ncbi:hypothetical protein BCR43DRAFT_527756 [Syncephalastrum racemosum]|uniref:PX domain-containing protein n=1 Tax=Syncephalastrum racemosum TaxID=13706 RepID=A0A1X2H1B1_SYNRA|nr:hypothetical protein BCR43DRAFT_527756 [Syncephalastrum racemosum]